MVAPEVTPFKGLLLPARLLGSNKESSEVGRTIALLFGSVQSAERKLCNDLATLHVNVYAVGLDVLRLPVGIPDLHLGSICRHAHDTISYCSYMKTIKTAS